MANVLHFTEQFNNAYWSLFDALTVSANSAPAPAFAGANAGFADTLTDASGSAAGNIYSTLESIPDDSGSWVASMHIQKDAVTSRFVGMGLQMTGGTGVITGMQFNTSTGAIVQDAAPNTPDASGVVDLDATWWRLWMRRANNSTGNSLATVFCYPAVSTTIGGFQVAATGSIIVWGVNLTPGTTLLTYEPEPTYEFAFPTVYLGAPFRSTARPRSFAPGLAR